MPCLCHRSCVFFFRFDTLRFHNSLLAPTHFLLIQNSFSPTCIENLTLFNGENIMPYVCSVHYFGHSTIFYVYTGPMPTSPNSFDNYSNNTIRLPGSFFTGIPRFLCLFPCPLMISPSSFEYYKIISFACPSITLQEYFFR